MINVSMKAMLEAGVHFGHQTRRWNPKMSRFIFGERNGIHIIDLQKTVKELKKVGQWVQDQATVGKTFLFVGTKKQAQELLRAEAERCGASYVSEKWLGGTLTNFATLRKSVKRLEELEKWQNDGIFAVLPKKEVSRLNKEMAKLKKNLSGLRGLDKLPDIMFIVDPVEEDLAVQEARKLNIPIVAIVDTNSDPDLSTYPIAANDDAIRSVRLILQAVSQTITHARAEFESKRSRRPDNAEGEAAPAPAETAEAPAAA